MAEPEVTSWRRLSTEDWYVVIGSDGIFERMSPQDVCDILGRDDHKENKNAFSKGSGDNLSVIVIPMR